MNTSLGGIFTQSYLTKMRIAETLESICERTRFDRISTGLIAEEAGISRSSFYYHFESKNAVVIWLSSQAYEQGIDQIGRTLTWFEGHLITTSFFDRFPLLFEAAASVTDYDAARPHFIRHRIESLTETIVDWKKVELTNRLRFQIEALAYAEVNMNRNYGAWYKELPVSEFSELMTSIAPRELFELLEVPVKPRKTPVVMMLD